MKKSWMLLSAIVPIGVGALAYSFMSIQNPCVWDRSYECIYGQQQIQKNQTGGTTVQQPIMIQKIVEELFDTGTELQEEPTINISLADQEATAQQAKKEAEAQKLVLEQAAAKLAAQQAADKKEKQSREYDTEGQDD
ncbi:MAG: hypothetical protein WCO66_02890 [Candidatus Absconditabacteria bacterium]